MYALTVRLSSLRAPRALSISVRRQRRLVAAFKRIALVGRHILLTPVCSIYAINNQPSKQPVNLKIIDTMQHQLASSKSLKLSDFM
jgi:hypothetical protein